MQVEAVLYDPLRNDYLKQKLEQLKAQCRKYGAAEVPLDFERDLYGYIATGMVLVVLGAYGKDLLLDFLSGAVVIPDKVRRKSFEDIASYACSRWFQSGRKVAARILAVMKEAEYSDPEAAMARCEESGMPPHVLWALAKYAGNDALADSLPGAPFFDEAQMERFKLKYEITAWLYSLRKARGDNLDAAFRKELEEKTLSYRHEIERLKEKLARAPEAVARKEAEAKGYRELYEQAKRELADALERFAEIAGQYETRIAELEAELAAVKDLLASDRERFLEGMTVCVVGDGRHRAGYETLVSAAGGRMRFVDGIEDASLVREAVRSSDALVLVGAYCKHKISVPAREEASRLGLPSVLCGSAGLGAFREALDKLKTKLAEAAPAAEVEPKGLVLNPAGAGKTQ